MKRIFFVLLFTSLIFLGFQFYSSKLAPKLVSTECEKEYKNNKHIYDDKTIECFNGRLAATNTVIVRFRSDLSKEQISEILNDFDIERSYEFNHNNYDIKTKKTGISELVARFSIINGVIAVSPVFNPIARIDNISR